MVRGVILFFYSTSILAQSSAVLKKKSDFADTAYFIEGASKNFTAKNTLLAGQAVSVLVGFAGVAVKCRVGQQLNPQK